MKKEHKIIFIIMIGIPILLLLLDLGEIRKIIPVTDNYDWLSFIGSCLSAFGALMLGLLAMRQNESLKELNKKMQDDNKIVNCYSIIDLMKVNYIDYRELLATDYYGSVLKKKDEINIEKNYQRFIFHIFDKKGIPLKYIKFNKIVIEPNYESNYSNRRERESHTYYYQSEEYNAKKLLDKLIMDDNNVNIFSLIKMQ